MMFFPPRNTKFIIECFTSCFKGLHDGCFMKLAEDPNRCVQVGENANIGDSLFVADVCERVDRQRFNYFSQTPPTTTQVPTTKQVPTTTQVPPTTTTPPSSTPSSAVCYPNFEFEGVRVANSAMYWGAPSFEADVNLEGNSVFNQRLEIRFEQTGSPTPHYVAK